MRDKIVGEHLMGLGIEAKVVINGIECSLAESMTIRVALEFFYMDLHTNGLGDDESGMQIKLGYLTCIENIRSKQRATVPA